MSDRSMPVRAASKAWCKPRSPARPIEKGRPGPGLLAHVVTSKHADHLLLYRQEQISERRGVDVSRRTLSEWNGAVADLLEPIVRAMHREQVCQSPWIQCDDTKLDVQDPSRAPEIQTGHIWVYRGELGDVVYDFTGHVVETAAAGHECTGCLSGTEGQHKPEATV